MSPFESAAAAAELARRLAVPWIADLRDPWALDEMQVYPTVLHRAREAARMRAALSSATAIVMNTAAAAEALRRRFPELSAKRIETIPNGYEADDFAAPPHAGDPDAFRIVHTGTLHTRLGRRTRATGSMRRVLGGDGDVDVLTRSPVFLLEALARLRDRDPSLGERIELHLAGDLGAEDLRAAQAVAGVHMHGYLPHGRSIDLVRSADLLFLPMHDLPAGRRARIVPGKTYEYAASGRPILAAVPEGDARDLLQTLPHANLCAPADVEAMAAIVARLAARKDAAGREPDCTSPAITAFDRRELTLQLAAVLDEALGRTPTKVRVAPRLRLVS
jgi:glycosyltransferase involved in cell wall biosynthesis